MLVAQSRGEARPKGWPAAAAVSAVCSRSPKPDLEVAR